MEGSIEEEILVIYHACEVGRSDVIQSAIKTIKTKCPNLVEKDISAIISTRRQTDDLSPLHIAAMNGHNDVIRCLLNFGANCTLRCRTSVHEGKRAYDLANELSKQAFHVYMFEKVAMGEISSIALLLNSGIPISITDNSMVNDSLLHWACSFNNPVTAKILIAEGGIDINILNQMGQNCLYFASKGLSLDLAKILVNEGIDIHHKDNNGQTVLDILNSKEKRSAVEDAIVQLLMSPPPATREYHQQYLDAIKIKQKEEEINILRAEHSITSISDTDDFGVKSNDSSFGDDGQKNEKSCEDMNSVSSDGPQLVLYPPVKKQSTEGKVIPLILSSASTLILSLTTTSYATDTDIYPLVLSSNLIHVLDKLGFQTQFKRSTNWAKIKLAIDPNLCPFRHSYRISVEPDYAMIIAADSTGLLYSLYTFIQVLQLHSEVVVNESRVTTVYVPPINISDQPDFMNRAVLWSYSHNVRPHFHAMKQNVELFSKLRLNILLLAIDLTTEENEIANIINHDGKLSTSTGTSSNSNFGNTSSHGHSAVTPSKKNPSNSNSMTNTEMISMMSNIHAMDQMCRSFCMDLVPLLTLTSPHQTELVTVDLLKNFSTKMVCINMTYAPHAIKSYLTEIQSLSGSSDLSFQSDGACQKLVGDICEKIMHVIQQSGITAVHLCCNSWVKNVASPYNIAIQLGLSVIQYQNIDELIPSSLFIKPVLLGSGHYLNDLIHTVKKNKHKNTSMSVFPAFSMSDILCPSILIKYCSFLFSGLLWNYDAFLDMLEVGTKTAIVTETQKSRSKDQQNNSVEGNTDIPGLYCCSIFREVISLILFNRRVSLSNDEESFVDNSSTSNNSHDNNMILYSTLLSILTGEHFIGHNSHISSQVIGHTSDSMTAATSVQMLSHAEQCLWSILTCPNHHLFMQSSAPPKYLLSECLRYYRKLISQSNWKLRSLPTKRNFLESFAGMSTTVHVDHRSGSTVGYNDSTNNGIANGYSASADQSYSSEVDEYFTILSLLSIICRAAIWSYIAYEKKHSTSKSSNDKTVKWGELLEHLPPGSKSDIANQLLETLTYIVQESRLSRFDQLWFDHDNVNVSSTEQNGNTGTIGNFKSIYLMTECPLIPLLSFFSLISDNLPMPTSPDETFKSVFPKAVKNKNSI